MEKIYLILSAILYGTLFPPHNFYFVSFIVFIPVIIFLLKNESIYSSIKWGVIYGVLASIISINWIYENRGADLLTRLLSGSGLFLIVGVQYSIFFVMTTISKKIFKNILFIIPIFWMIAEEFLFYDQFSFPWVVPSLIVSGFDLFIQVGDVVGSVGISGLIFLGNILILQIFFSIKNNKKIVLSLMSVSLFFLVVIGYGYVKIDGLNFQSDTTKLALVNPSIAVEDKWNDSLKPKLIERQKFLTDSISKFNPDLIVWGETNFPGYLKSKHEDVKWFRDFSKERKIPLAIGTLGYQLKEEGYDKFNSIIYFDENGKTTQYNKIMLVPFGEFFPYSDYFPFLKDISLGQANFDRGTKYVDFQLENSKICVNICYEALFPHFIRDLSLDSDFIINVSNDAWYEGSNEIYQHNVFNKFRAIENRKPVVRIGNRALTGYYDCYGNYTKVMGIYENGATTIDLKRCSDGSIFSKISPIIRSTLLMLGFLIILISIVKIIMNRFSSNIKGV
ncbi:MAG: apolipoprotein N-acyltransferase [Candidatus Delongbacteria bacterium]|nr:apolipoprotein N-acyltransferase [Candidatus Delongbacteria bacterium]MBN2834202.1 apolipoprotein N-acyltransferase [Candidatus Delongbacteria bacterium]